VRDALERELIDYLCSREFAVIVEGKAVLTNKFYEIFPPPNTTIIKYNEITPNQVLTQAVHNYNNPTAEEKKQIWTKFINDSELPYRVTAPGGGTYTIRQYSPAAVNKLLSILRNKDLDYKRFTESTKHYYKTVAYKLTLQRYLCEEVWSDEYLNFGKKSVGTSTDGSNRWED